jgi:pimeloyl-ACP methyl ester carboxylesterase
MQAAIEGRELVTMAAGGICLRGTYHRPKHHGFESRVHPDEPSRIGVLFLNSGFMPRASGGDAAVYWADSFAQCGYPSFRLDLPGLGDSEGDLPRKRLDFNQLVNSGHYARFISIAAKNLIERFEWSGVVLLGHCAGAVSAIYAARASKHIKGIVLLEPYFFREEPKRAEIRNKMSFWVTRNKLAGQLGIIYGHLKKLNRMCRADSLPGNANLPLIGCWSNLASAGFPMLILNVRGPRLSVGEFDYLGYLQRLSGPAARLVIKFVDGANHSFADDVGRMAVRRHCEQWLDDCFPSVECEEIAALSGGATSESQ